MKWLEFLVELPLVTESCLNLPVNRRRGVKESTRLLTASRVNSRGVNLNDVGKRASEIINTN